MDLNALNLLVDIIETGNLSKAAVRRGMGRAAVSHRLGQFEQALGQQLLRRTTRQVEPTELGWKLYRHGLSIRQELQAAQDSVDSLGQAPQGKVRLSVPSGFGQLAMTAWLTEFMQRHPGIALEVIFDNTVEDLLAGRIDCAVRVMSEPPPTWWRGTWARCTTWPAPPRPWPQQPPQPATRQPWRPCCSNP